jgi:hypothetical protein
MRRAYYSDSFANFRKTKPLEILGTLAQNNEFPLEQTQREGWLEEVRILQSTLSNLDGAIYFEYAIPRMGRRIDVVLLIDSVIFVVEFKVGEKEFTPYALNQTWDYALDLKNFHESSREHLIAPVLIATNAEADTPFISPTLTPHNDKVLSPIRCNGKTLSVVIARVLDGSDGPSIDPAQWENGRYSPTPTIIEAAMALYSNHSVSDISRNDAAAINLSVTSDAISEIIRSARENSFKGICFVTGVPGAGKTLVGLKIATERRERSKNLHSVFLSGNDPLVNILREALARDRVRNERNQKRKKTKSSAMSEVKAFIQPIRHFRKEYLIDKRPPIDHVALFDEAQRAWDLEETAAYLLRKSRIANFDQSEPEFLISCLDRHPDWAVVVCLVGGGQEINRGEAGISEWIESLNRSFKDWHVYISSQLTDTEYAAGHALEKLRARQLVETRDELHLAVSMRSFRAEHVSLLVKQLLDLDKDDARKTLSGVSENYPMVITRDLTRAKQWLREQARGSERYGIVASSQAQRLKPHAIDVKSPVDPIHWFLDGPEDVRSSYYLEDVVTEFDVQGLELDWTCVTWDADFRYTEKGWDHRSFCGDRWNYIKKAERKSYQKNAYRVLLTRARQGMVICVPPGDPNDPTRKPEFYDPTFEYLAQVGFSVI